MMTVVIPTWILIILGVPAAVVVISCAIIGFMFILSNRNSRYWK